jgi:hypothetical protein
VHRRGFSERRDDPRTFSGLVDLVCILEMTDNDPRR